jgi:cyclohexadieny/prephenate dehydrogenase
MCRRACISSPATRSPAPSIPVPDAGFAELFEGRWAIADAAAGTDPAATEKLALLAAARLDGRGDGPRHHDQVLAITSHLPHLIAYTIVGTATISRPRPQSEVIKYSASGFRDFTRIAASDPVMWRDVFLHNREAVLEMLAASPRTSPTLQRAIRWGEGDKLFDLFTRTRAVRRAIIDAKQA